MHGGFLLLLFFGLVLLDVGGSDVGVGVSSLNNTRMARPRRRKMLRLYIVWDNPFVPPAVLFQQVDDGGLVGEDILQAGNLVGRGLAGVGLVPGRRQAAAYQGVAGAQ
jgi:hypothetical protein